MAVGLSVGSGADVGESGALKPGDVLEYHLEAQDNFAFEGKHHDVVSSGKYRITHHEPGAV